jgi:outer membrane protein
MKPNLSRRFSLRPTFLGRGSNAWIAGFPLLLATLFFWRPAGAEDLMEIYRLAQKEDPTYQREFYRHEASPEVLSQAYADLLPTLNAEGTYNRKMQEIKETDIAVYGAGIARYPVKGYTVSLTQPLFRYASIVRVQQAGSEVKRADLKFEAAKQDLLLRVAEAYMGALEAQDTVTFTSAEEAAVAIHFELANNRYRSGLAPVTDYHDAKARLADTVALKTRAENKLDDAIEALVELTGEKIENLAKLNAVPVAETLIRQKSGRAAANLSPGAQGAPQAGTVPGAKAGSGTESEPTQTGMPLVSPNPDDPEQWIKAASEQNLEVEAQRQAVEVAEREIERQRAAHLPTLSVVGRLNRDDEGGSLFGGESDVMTREAIVQLNVPIFQGLSVLSRTREAIELHKAARQDLEKEIRAAKRKAKAAFLGVKSAMENAEAYKQSVLSNYMALEAKRQGFRSGLFPSLAVLDAERDLHRAKQDYARAHYEYILNSLRLKKAAGTLSEADIAGINEWLQ